MTYFRHRISGPGASGDIWVNTIHVLQNVANIVTAHTAMVAFVDDFYGAHYKTLCSPHFHLNQVTTDQLDDVTGHTLLQKITSRAIVGTGAGQQVSPRTCMVLSIDTGNPGRHNHGRVFLPGPDAGHYAADGQLAEAACQTTANAFMSAMGDLNGTSPIVLYNRATKTGNNVYNIRVNTIPGDQRRRTNKTTGTWTTGA
jgi:hypothetical protein